MPTMKRHKTDHIGVFFIKGTDPATGKPEKVYYIVYRNREGKLIEEKAGRQNKDDMTPIRASKIRARRIHGDEPSNKERREAARELSNRWTIGKLAEEYFTNRERQKTSARTGTCTSDPWKMNSRTRPPRKWTRSPSTVSGKNSRSGKT